MLLIEHEVFSMYDFDKNKINLENITTRSHKKVWWLCKNNHSFYQRISHRVNGNKCNICTNQVINEFNCVFKTHPELITYWYDKTDPRTVCFGTSKNIQFKCSAGHIHKTKPYYYNKNGCPYCKRKLPSIEYCLASEYPDILLDWGDKNKKTPYEYLPHSNSKAWFKCIKCGNESTKIINNRIKRGAKKCKKCKTYENSIEFFYPHILKYWNDERKPSEFSKNGSRKIKWKCEKGHTREVTISDFLRSNCPKCSRRVSKASQRWLDKMKIPEEFREKYLCINGHRYFVDAFDPQTNTVYEYFGIFWHGHPKYFDQNKINPVCKKTYGKLYKKTLEREKIIKNAGYNLIVEWEKNNE